MVPDPSGTDNGMKTLSDLCTTTTTTSTTTTSTTTQKCGDTSGISWSMLRSKAKDTRQDHSNKDKINSRQSARNNSHNCGIYCTECEIARKKSRTLKLSTGGDVILNSSIKDLSSTWTMQRTGLDSGQNNNAKNTNADESPFCIRICMPSFDSRTHRVFISVNVEEKSRSCYKDDYSIISKNLYQLKESGWFFDALTYQEAQNFLEKTRPGTFLMRNSSDSRFLFSLSVQTVRGPTSVRILYTDGKFQLDTDEKFNGALPKEESVIALIERHLESARCAGQVWVEPNGKMYSPVVLTKPLLKTVPSLRHLSRVKLNNHKELQAGLIPHGIKHYLAEYPYRI